MYIYIYIHIYTYNMYVSLNGGTRKASQIRPFWFWKPWLWPSLILRTPHISVYLHSIRGCSYSFPWFPHFKTSPLIKMSSIHIISYYIYIHTSHSYIVYNFNSFPYRTRSFAVVFQVKTRTLRELHGRIAAWTNKLQVGDTPKSSNILYWNLWWLWDPWF